MKIVHVVEPLAGGMVTFLKSLVENLPDDFHIIVHGERPKVTPLAEVKKHFVFRNVKFLKWKSAQRSVSPQKDLAAFLELYAILKRLKSNNSVDIVHLHCSKGGFLGRIVCKLLGIEDIVVYTPNGAPFMVGTSKAANFFYKKLERVAALFGGQVVCCSPSEQKAYKMAGINSITINNGIQFDKIARARSKRKKNNVFRIVTAGRIVHQKNPILFNKIATYFESFPQFEFIWVGDGTERDILTAKNIHITGWLQKDGVNELVTNADVYLSTANFEGLPFSVLEALALNKPVLLTDCVGNKDLVIKGLNGDVFTTADEAINKVLHFYNNYSMLQVMGEHSGAHCQTSFDSTDTYKSYKKLYQKAAFTNMEPTLSLNQIAWNKMKLARFFKIAR